ncbi:MAG: DUF1775 domain-containing protein [Ilumatobacteraceae bacterium]|jgi:uncharacterized protein YcnI
MFRRAVVLCLALAAGVLGFAAPASAHIDPDPTEAQAGSAVSVAFTVEHGCEGSPTVQLDMRLPDGVTDASPDAVDGWDGSIDGDVITFVGGSLPDDVEGTFSVSMTLPPTPDVTVYFPFVQRCEEGEIRWIAIPTEPGEELDEPAPAMLLTGPVATTTGPATTAAPATTEASATTAPATTAGPATSSPSTDVVATTEMAATSSVPAVAVSTDENGNSDTGTIVFIVSMLVIAGIGVYVWFRSRSARAAAG